MAKQKRYYKVGEKVFIKETKKLGVITALNINPKEKVYEATVEIVEDGYKMTRVFQLWEIDKDKNGYYKRFRKSEPVGLNRPFFQVKDFQKAFGHPTADTPVAMDVQRAFDRTAWTAEELVEFLFASCNNDIDLFNTLINNLQYAVNKTRWKIIDSGVKSEDVLVGQADALTDAVYFLMGTFVEIGVLPNQLFDIVQNANMAKLFPDGKPRYREEDGKVMKPEGWEAPEPKLKAEIAHQVKMTTKA